MQNIKQSLLPVVYSLLLSVLLPSIAEAGKKPISLFAPEPAAVENVCQTFLEWGFSGRRLVLMPIVENLPLVDLRIGLIKIKKALGEVAADRALLEEKCGEGKRRRGKSCKEYDLLGEIEERLFLIRSLYERASVFSSALRKKKIDFSNASRPTPEQGVWGWIFEGFRLENAIEKGQALQEKAVLRYASVLQLDTANLEELVDRAASSRFWFTREEALLEDRLQLEENVLGGFLDHRAKVLQEQIHGRLGREVRFSTAYRLGGITLQRAVPLDIVAERYNQFASYLEESQDAMGEEALVGLVDLSFANDLIVDQSGLQGDPWRHASRFVVVEKYVDARKRSPKLDQNGFTDVHWVQLMRQALKTGYSPLLAAGRTDFLLEELLAQGVSFDPTVLLILMEAFYARVVGTGMGPDATKVQLRKIAKHYQELHSELDKLRISNKHALVEKNQKLTYSDWSVALLVLSSFERGEKFYPARAAEYYTKVFYSLSWFLDPSLGERVARLIVLNGRWGTDISTFLPGLEALYERDENTDFGTALLALGIARWQIADEKDEDPSEISLTEALVRNRILKTYPIAATLPSNDVNMNYDYLKITQALRGHASEEFYPESIEGYWNPFPVMSPLSYMELLLGKSYALKEFTRFGSLSILGDFLD